MLQENTVLGVVKERHPNSLFTLQLEDGREVKAYLSGKMRKNRIRILEGDVVKVLMDEYGDSHRIVYRKDSRRPNPNLPKT